MCIRDSTGQPTEELLERIFKAFFRWLPCAVLRGCPVSNRYGVQGASPTPSRLFASRHLERADLRRIARRLFLEVVADVPHRAVVVRVEGGRGVVLPAQRVDLRALTLGKNGLGERQLAQRIVRLSPGKTLPGKVRRTAERVSDTDIAELVDGAAGHPSVVAVAQISALLVQRDRPALVVHTELVPPHTAASGGRRNRVRGENRFVIAESPVDEPRHDLVAL